MRVLCCVLAGLLCACQHPAPFPAPVEKEKPVAVVEAAGAPLAELRTKPAADKTFQLLVSMRGVSEPVALPMRAYSNDFRESTNAVTAGDPIDRAQVKAMVSGEDQKAVTTWMRAVRRRDQNCVLAEQEFGFEVVKRNHTLICADGATARVAWKQEEGEGPTWTSVDVKDLDSDGADELVEYTGWAAPEGAETLTAKAWKWKGAELQTEPAATRTVIAGSFASAAAAREARLKAGRVHSDCSKYFWVLADGGKFQLAAKTTANAETHPIWKQWQACYPHIRMSN